MANSCIPLGGLEALEDEEEFTPAEIMEERVIGIMRDVSRLQADINKDPDVAVLASFHADYLIDTAGRLGAVLLKLDAINELMLSTKAVRDLN